MGQTQLLMIVLAVIIVGIAVAVGITQFGESAVTANRDAVQLDCQRIVSNAQQWYKKPSSLGGGNNSFTGCSLAKLGVATPNQNGSYTLDPGDGTSITVVGTGTEKNPAGAAIAVTMKYFAANDSTAYSDNM